MIARSIGVSPAKGRHVRSATERATERYSCVAASKVVGRNDLCQKESGDSRFVRRVALALGAVDRPGMIPIFEIRRLAHGHYKEHLIRAQTHQNTGPH